MTPAEKYLRSFIAKADLPRFVGERDAAVSHHWLDFASNVPPSRGDAHHYPPQSPSGPLQAALNSLFSAKQRKELTVDNLVVTRGVSEGIDLLTRACGGPGRTAAAFRPTFPMYRYWARLNGVRFVELNGTHVWRKARLPAKVVPARTGLLWLCNPNNPTGSTCSPATVRALAKRTKGILAVDETYIDFCPEQSAVSLVAEIPNLVIARSLSKAWGLASERVGVLVAHESIVRALRAIQGPYALSAHTLQVLSQLPARRRAHQTSVRATVRERQRVYAELAKLVGPANLIPSEANFFFIARKQPQKLVTQLERQRFLVAGIVDATPSGVRFSIRSRADNDRLLRALAPLLR